MGRVCLWALLFTPGPVLGRGSLLALAANPGPNLGRVNCDFKRAGRGPSRYLVAGGWRDMREAQCWGCVGGGDGSEKEFFDGDSEASGVKACGCAWIGDSVCSLPFLRTVPLKEHTLVVGGGLLGRIEGPEEQPQVSAQGASRNASPFCPEPRSSKRLAKGRSASILLWAMARKIIQREGGDESGVDRNIKRIICKGRLCGVDLADDEAKHFDALFSKRD